MGRLPMKLGVRPARRSVLMPLVIVLGLVVGLTGWMLQGPSRPRPAFVLASASLGPVLTKLLPQLEAAVGRHLQIEAAGTPTLLAQIRSGVRADLIVSADEKSATSLEKEGLAVGTPQLVAYNRLAVVTEPGNPRRLHSLADLERKGLVIALAGPEVPAGRYARTAFAAAHLPVPRAASEPSVDGVLTAVRTGAADAGVVYATDARRAAPGVAHLPLDLGIRTTCVAVSIRSGDLGLSRRLLAALTDAGVRKALADFGFELP